ncbi:MAG: FHA domain-containing protein [Deltaproteobacteria bacterium]|nr:MAG: FHA domain-containing protein [Deltaproteobacteria bacterium]
MPNVSRPVKEVPVLVKKDIETRLFKLVAYKQGQVEYEFDLDKKKLLVGSAENCDLRITDPHISHYHALLMVDEHGCKILDLESNNGIWLNGMRERSFYFSSGDCIKLGPIEFHVEEILTTVEKGQTHIEDQDHQVNVLDETHIHEMPSELPPLEGLVVIDGEYCDIKFDETSFTPVDHIPAISPVIATDQFIDTEENKEILPIARQSDSLAIEVTVLSNGVALSVDYFPMKDGIYNASPVTSKGHMVHIPCLDTEDNLPFFQISNGHIDFFPIDGFKAVNLTTGNKIFNGSDREQLEQNQVLSYNYKTVQVVAKITEAPANLRFAPFFGRDRNFQKQAIQIFSGLMSIMLLLLLVDVEAPKPEKKIAVIYRKAIKSDQKAQDKSSQDVSNTNQDKGVKKEQQSEDKPKFAKAEPNQNKQKKSEQNQQKVAQTQKSSAQKQPEKTKVKAYEFKTSKSFNSMFSKSNSVTPTKIQNNTVATTNGFDSSKAASSADLKSKTSVDAGTFGKDFRGNYDSSAGAKGLASKSGVDTSFVEPQTVVLGSMDPELLRKILREYLPQFRHCYQKELERNGNTEGVVDLNFRITGTGGVSNIKIGMKGAKFSNAGSGCMAGVLKLIDFPKPKGGGVVDVRQPLNFFSEQEKI